jgi:hypothetical protein
VLATAEVLVGQPGKEGGAALGTPPGPALGGWTWTLALVSRPSALAVPKSGPPPSG